MVGDRLSGWPEVYSTPSGTTYAGARGLVACLRKLFGTFGVPEELSSDGGPEFVANSTLDFLKTWGVKHRKSSAYFPRSNGRAEVAVKSVKRLLRSNISPSGDLDNDRFLRALLQLRNTPDPDSNVSPSQILFGRPLRDAFLFSNRLEKYSNPSIHPTWREAWAAKETALRARYVKSSEKLSENSKALAPLQIGQKCFVQNQFGSAPKRWDRTGLIVERLPHDQYCVKIDGSGRVTTRNRKFLRGFEPISTGISGSSPENASPPRFPIPLPPRCPIPLPPQSPTPPHPLDDTLCSDPLTVAEEVTPSNNAPVIPDEGSGHPDSCGVIPAALRRILPHNKPGAKEAIRSPEQGGRRHKHGRTNLAGDVGL